MRVNDGSPATKISYLSWINLAANSADQIATVALPVLYVTTYDGDASATSILTIGATLPMLLFSLPMGALTDRSSLRSLVFWGELVRLVSILGMIVVLSLPSPSVMVLAVLATLGGTGTVAFQVAAPAMVARATVGNDRRKLNSRIEFARSIAITAGPPLAGIIVGLAGGDIALGLAAACCVLALVATRHLPALSREPAAKSTPAALLAEGIRFTMLNPWLRPILYISMAFNLGWYVVLGVIVAWADREINMSSLMIGAMFGFYGFGMMLGAYLVNRFADALPTTTLVRVGPWCGFAFASLIAFSSRFEFAGLLIAAFFLVGFGPVIWTIVTLGIRQTVTPPALLGRVSATIMMASAGARPAGAALGYVGYQLGGYGAVFALGLLLFGTQALLVGQSTLVREEPSTHIALVPHA